MRGFVEMFAALWIFHLCGMVCTEQLTRRAGKRKRRRPVV